MKPLIGLPEWRPERFCCRQSGVQELFQACQFRRTPLFSSIRTIEEVIACSRSYKRSPAASSGGYPSSVRALRTARQYPRATFGLFIGARLQCSFDGTNPTHLFFEFFLGMSISFSHGLRCFAEVMEVAQLMRNARQGAGNSFANGVLPIGSDSVQASARRKPRHLNGSG